MALIKIDKCPITSDCKVKGLFKDTETLEIMRFVYETNELKLHVCNPNTGESVKPTTLYLGEWFNVATQRVRWTGPFRHPNSATRPPADAQFKRRGGSNPAWKLTNIHVVENLAWKLMDSKEVAKVMPPPKRPRN
jgi:hypothetical protein